MAHVKKVEGRSYPYVYNVDMTVGNRKEMTSGGGITTYTTTYGPNKRDDVMLVQYLLKRVYQKGEKNEPRLKAGTANPAELKIDGYHGPKTQSAIEHFQLEVRRAGMIIATDGCVDSEKGPVSSISQTGYTINFLNKYFWKLYPIYASNPATDNLCPAELKQKLAAI